METYRIINSMTFIIKKKKRRINSFTTRYTCSNQWGCKVAEFYHVIKSTAEVNFPTQMDHLAFYGVVSFIAKLPTLLRTQLHPEPFNAYGTINIERLQTQLHPELRFNVVFLDFLQLKWIHHNNRHNAIIQVVQFTNLHALIII